LDNVGVGESVDDASPSEDPVTDGPTTVERVE